MPASIPDQLGLCLRVLAKTETLPPGYPDVIAVRRATAKIFKSVKNARRAERRDAISAADKAVLKASATGSPERIDDETESNSLAGVERVGGARRRLHPAATVLHLQNDYVEVDALLSPSSARAARE